MVVYEGLADAGPSKPGKAGHRLILATDAKQVEGALLDLHTPV